MSAFFSQQFEGKIHSILGSVRSAGITVPGQKPPLGLGPFVTISRQAGIDASRVAHLLAHHLTALTPQQRPWETFDRELVEKVAADHRISAELIESLENSSHNWLQEFFHGLSHDDFASPSELKVFHRVAATVRALAQTGRVVLVGIGSSFMTAGMPWGVHVRLVAPLEERIALLARQLHVVPGEAAARLRIIDENRMAFYRRFFRVKTLDPEEFTLTINVATLKDEQIAASIMPAVTRLHAGASSPG